MAEMTFGAKVAMDITRNTTPPQSAHFLKGASWAKFDTSSGEAWIVFVGEPVFGTAQTLISATTKTPTGTDFHLYLTMEAHELATKKPVEPSERKAKVIIKAVKPKLKNGVHEAFQSNYGPLYPWDVTFEENGAETTAGANSKEADKPPFTAGESVEATISVNNKGYTSIKKVQQQGGGNRGGGSYNPKIALAAAAIQGCNGDLKLMKILFEEGCKYAGI